MRFDVVTLFPAWISQLEAYGVVGRALRAGRVELACWNPRDYAERADRRIDDRTYGGGPGMLLQAEPLIRTVDAARAASAPTASTVVMLSAGGDRFDQSWARALAERPAVMLVCGRYEGVDQRFIDARVDAMLSVGDFVASGGELPAMLVIDAIARQIEGVLGNPASAASDSFAGGALEAPQYTRPPVAVGRAVPDELLSGDHGRIARWRHKQALGQTWLRRPDLLAAMTLSDEQRALLTEFVAEYEPD